MYRVYACFSMYYSMFQSIILGVPDSNTYKKNTFVPLNAFYIFAQQNTESCLVPRSTNTRSRDSKLCTPLENIGIYDVRTM